MEETFKEVKEKISNIEATDVDLQGKIDARYTQLEGKIDAGYTRLEGKIDAGYTRLEGKIDAGEVTELRKNLSFAIPNYDTFVESKYVIHI